MRFVSGGSDGLIKYWTYNTGTKKFDEAVIMGYGDWIRDVSFAQFNTMGLTLASEYYGASDMYDTIAICTEKGTASVLRMEGSEWKEYKLAPSKASPTKLSWGVDGNNLAISYEDNSVQVFEEVSAGKWEVCSQVSNEAPKPEENKQE